MKKKRIWGLAVIIILFFLVAMYVSYENIWSRVLGCPWAVITAENSKNNLGNVNVVELQDGDILKQNIKMVSNNFTGFAVKIYKQSKEEGNVKIILQDKNGRELEQWNLDSKELNEKEFYGLYLEKVRKVKVGDIYTVEIIPQLKENDSFGIELTSSTILTGNMILNGEATELSIAYQLYDGTVSSLKYLFLAFIIVGVISTISLAIILQSKSKQKIMLSFVVLAFFIGSMYIFAMPPFSAPDEAKHIITSYAGSNKLLGKEVVDANGSVVSNSDLGICYAHEEYPTRSTYVEYLKGALGKKENVVNTTISIGTPLSSSWIGYFPQIIGVSFARIIGLNGEQVLILGRIFALLWYCMIMGMAINIVPFKKIVFFVVGLMPMTMQQVASFNYDSVLFGFCFLLIAYILNLIFRKDYVNWKDILVILFLAIGIGKIKYIYLPILVLLAFIPKEKFGGKNKKNKIIAFGMLFLMIGLGYSQMTMLVHAAEIGKLRADGLYQYTIKYVFQNIGDTIIVAVRTLLNQISFYIESMIASPLGWVDIELPEIIVFAFIIVLLLSGLTDREKYSFSKKEKGVCYITAIFISGLVMAALLIAYTYIGSDIIMGIQGRYFIPILPLVLCAMECDWMNLRRNIDVEIMYAVQGLQLYAIWAITSTVVSR